MTANTDIVIFGGGIAGLWLLDRLRTLGYHAILLEQTALGHGQSIASQGMIHGGMKYALGGALTGAAEAIADMPQLWRQCLAGTGEVDLRGTRILSDSYYLWPRNTLRSRFTAFLGSKAVRGKVTSVEEAELPEFFRGRIKSPLYQLQDLVLDVPSLLETLAQRHREWIHRIDWSRSQLDSDAHGNITALHLENGIQLKAQRYICTSGNGAQFFLDRLRPANVSMQQRPLQMVVVKHQLRTPVYVHCVSDQLTATPELTITTHTCKDGSTAWYLGGELAESGVQRSSEQQVQHTRQLLQQLFPWCDFITARLHCYPIARAEARQPDGKRPDQASLLPAQNMYYCWPTKLTLAPNLANTVLAQLRAEHVAPAGDKHEIPLTGLQFPPLATTPWDLA